MSRDVLWDSSAVVAVLDADDVHHRTAMAVAQRLSQERRPAFVTNYVEAETHALLLRRLGRSAAREWLFSDALAVVVAAETDVSRAKALLAARADKDWSLCDAISFAVMDARRVRTAFSFDRHFSQVGRYTVLGLES